MNQVGHRGFGRIVVTADAEVVMMAWLIDSAVVLRRLVVAAVVLVLGLGILQLRQAKVDVYPDFRPTQVQVQTEALGLSTTEVENLITSPLEQNLFVGIPRVEELRSRSMPGLSVVDLTFEPGTPLYQARQLVQERLTRTKLLPQVGQPPNVVQPTSSLSRVAMIGLRSPTVSLVDMSVLAHWQIRPRLLSIPGVANVSMWGVRDRQLQVQVDPNRLVAKNVSLTQIVDTTGNALWVSPLNFIKASVPGTGGFFESPSQRIGIQHISPLTTAKDLAGLTLPRADGSTVRLGDVATVTEDHQPLIGDATAGPGTGLMLVVERFPNADVGQVTRDVDSALAAMRPGLKGITLDPTVFRPVSYLDTALGRLGLAVLLGLILMVATIAVVTLSWRVTLVTFGSVAVSLVGAVWVLHLRGSTLTMMTVLGLAAVLALVVDDAVGDVAALRARFGEYRSAGKSSIAAIATEALRARRGGLTFATIAVLVAMAPLLLLGGTAGVFAGPAVLTFVLAALASLVAALVVTPTLGVLLLAGDSKDAFRVGRFPGWVRSGVHGLVGPSVGRRIPAALALTVLLGLAGLGIWRLPSGAPLPALQDSSVLVSLEAAPGTSLPEMDRVTGRAAAALRMIPGIRSASTQVGRAVGSDVIANVDSSQIWLTLGSNADHAGTLAAVRATVSGFPGLHASVQTYADARLAAANNASAADLVVRVSGEDPATIQGIATQVRNTLAAVDGVISPRVEVQPTQPVVQVKVDITAAQRYGLQPGEIRRAVGTLVSGLTVGSLYQDQAIFDVVVWGVPAARQSVNDLQAVRVDTPSGSQVPLGSVAAVSLTSDPAVATHHNASRTLDITAGIGGRNYADVARDVTSRLQRLDYPYQNSVELINNRQDGAGFRAGPVAGVAGAAAVAVTLLVFLLLQAATRSWRGAAALCICVGLAGTGGLLAASFLGGVGTVPVLAGVFAVVALAVRQAVVLVRRARELAGRPGSEGPAEAMRQAAAEQSPAVVTTVLVTAGAFAPAAVMPGGAGLELLHPFAVTLLAGLLTCTAVVLYVVPVVYVALGGLRPSGGADDDPLGGRHVAPEAGQPAVPESIPAQSSNGRPHEDRKAGAVMRTSSPKIATLIAVAGLGLTGCQATAQGTSPAGTPHAAVLQPAKDGGPGSITLTSVAEERVGIKTTPVGPGRGTGRTGAIPYSGLVYDTKGATWTFVRIGDRTYQRARVTVAGIDGDQVELTEGPSQGSEVVTVGAAELVGVEAGISGEE